MITFTFKVISVQYKDLISFGMANHPLFGTFTFQCVDCLPILHHDHNWLMMSPVYLIELIKIVN